MTARFSIGIDLGTTSSALAYVPLTGDAQPEVLNLPQWETPDALVEAPTLPSFLYLPDDALAAQLRGRLPGTQEWIAGRLARRRAGETPGRVVRSAKSWLCHHAADRTAPILPWGSEDLVPAQKISPVRAAALILNYLRGAWDSRFAQSGCAFDDQEITITVPASFDAAAQRLTLNAAEEAGFPSSVRLLEEPQAAFYCWLEQAQFGKAIVGRRRTQCRAAARLDRRYRRRHLGFQLVRSCDPVRRAASPTSRGSLSANTFCWVATTSTWPSRSCSNRDLWGNAARFPAHNGSISSRHVAI